MQRIPLLITALAGVVVGASLFSTRAAHSQWPTTDVLTQAAIAQLQRIATNAITQVESAVTNIGTNIVNRVTGLETSINDIMSRGFSQQANYSKAAVGAQQQIADAANTANAVWQRDNRNAEIRDEHVVNPNMCAAIDGGVAASAAAQGGYGVLAAISEIMDRRGRAGPGTPSYNGTAQGAASINQVHLGTYCNRVDVEAGLCAAESPLADLDQRASSLWYGDTYPDQAAVNAAKDYQTLLIQPVAPAAIRGSQLASIHGQEAAAQRRGYNARMSLAHFYVARTIAIQTPSVDVSPEQRRILESMGLTPGAQASWLQLLQVEADRRLSDVSWHAYLAAAPPATVQREISQQLALTNSLLFRIYKDGLERGVIAAAQMALQVDRDFDPAVRMPTPNIN